MCLRPRQQPLQVHWLGINAQTAAAVMALPFGPDVLSLAAYQILLSRHCRAQSPSIQIFASSEKKKSVLSTSNFIVDMPVNMQVDFEEHLNNLTSFAAAASNAKKQPQISSPNQQLQGLRAPSDLTTPSFSAGFSFGATGDGVEKSASAPVVDLELRVELKGVGEGSVQRVMSAALLFRPGIFHVDAIDIFSKQMCAILDGIVSSSIDTKVGELPLMSSKEKRTIVSSWNATDAPWPRDACIHDLFLLQAKKNPSNNALISGDRHITYGELLKDIEHVADLLVEQGVAPNTPVALLLERSISSVTAVYAVLFAGGFYVPLDAEYPDERIHGMLQDSSPSVIITNKQHARRIPKIFEGVVIMMDALPPTRSTRHAITRPQQKPSPSSAVYCLFTSGSTGKPKGVIVEHQGEFVVYASI
jgi:hypothetical protein